MTSRKSSRSKRDPALWQKHTEAVYAVVRRIPRGRVMTYGAIARQIPPPAGMEPASYDRIGPRWVGYALRGCPDDVPWQRVINARGEMSPRFGGSHDLQRHLLESEGIVLDNRGRVRLADYGWEPSHPE